MCITITKHHIFHVITKLKVNITLVCFEVAEKSNQWINCEGVRIPCSTIEVLGGPVPFDGYEQVGLTPIEWRRTAQHPCCTARPSN